MIDKPEEHAKICSTLNDTYRKKNHDYGDSFAQLRERLPNAILTRLYDKYLRLETLLNGAAQQVNDESINDTLADMANYCIMELVERKIDDSKKTQGICRDTAIEPSEMGEEDVSEEPVKGKYEGMTNEELKYKICLGMYCGKCPIPNAYTGTAIDGCSKWIEAHPAEFRAIAIPYLEGLEGKG